MLTQPPDMDTDTDISVRKPTDMSTFRGPSPVSPPPQNSSQAESTSHIVSPRPEGENEARGGTNSTDTLAMAELNVSTLPRAYHDIASWRAVRRSYAEISSPHMETEFTASGIVTIFTPPRTPSVGSTEGLYDSAPPYATLHYPPRSATSSRRSVATTGSAEGLCDPIVRYSREPRRLSSRNASVEGLCEPSRQAPVYSRVQTRQRSHSTHSSHSDSHSQSIQTLVSPSRQQECSMSKPYSIAALQEECMLALQHKLKAQSGEYTAEQMPFDGRYEGDGGILGVPTVSQQVSLQEDSLPRASRPDSLPLPDGASKQTYCCDDLEHEADSGYSHSQGQYSDLPCFTSSQGPYSDLPTFTPSQGHYSDLQTLSQGHGDYSDLHTLDLELAAITSQEIADVSSHIFFPNLI